MVETAYVETKTHTQPFNGPFSRTTWVSQYQKGKTNLAFSEARDGEWQWHQLGHMQVCTLLQTDNHTSTPPLSFLQAGCPSCRRTNSVKALKALYYITSYSPSMFDVPRPLLCSRYSQPFLPASQQRQRHCRVYVCAGSMSVYIQRVKPCTDILLF